MAKYIDADLLRKEIDNVEEEARKVRVSGTDKEAIGADGKVKLCLELKAIINSLQQEEPEKPIPNDLEEAAMNYIAPIENEDGLKVINFSGQDIKDAFIAGAKWQAEQDKETIELAEDHAYLAGAVNEREKIMKEAVEGKIAERRQGKLYARCQVPKTMKVEFCDKVRIIIVKEN